MMRSCMTCKAIKEKEKEFSQHDWICNSCFIRNNPASASLHTPVASVPQTASQPARPPSQVQASSWALPRGAPAQAPLSTTITNIEKAISVSAEGPARVPVSPTKVLPVYNIASPKESPRTAKPLEGWPAALPASSAAPPRSTIIPASQWPLAPALASPGPASGAAAPPAAPAAPAAPAPVQPTVHTAWPQPSVPVAQAQSVFTSAPTKPVVSTTPATKPPVKAEPAWVDDLQEVREGEDPAARQRRWEQNLLALKARLTVAAPDIATKEEPVDDSWVDGPTQKTNAPTTLFSSKIGEGCAIPGREKFQFFDGRYTPPVKNIAVWINELHTKDIHVPSGAVARFPQAALKRMTDKAMLRWTGEWVDPSLWDLTTPEELEAKRMEELRNHWNLRMFLGINDPQKRCGELEFLAIYAYSYQIPEKEDNPDNLQIYGVANKVMRLLGESQRTADVKQQHRPELEAFRPFIFWLDEALRALPDPSPTFVFRGLPVRIDKKRFYRIGHNITWHSFSSTTSDRHVILEFSEAGGTCFLVHVRTARPMDVFSAFPSERELLLGSNSTFEVMNVVSDTHLQMMESKLDIVVLREVLDREDDASSSLQFKVRAAGELSSLYKTLWDQFICPRGRPLPSSAPTEEYNLEEWLLEKVDRPNGVVLITAQAGAGKTTLGLWLIDKLLEEQGPEEDGKKAADKEGDAPADRPKKPILPLFLSLPGVGAEVFSDMGLVRSLKKQYALTNAHLDELFRRYKVVLVLDSFDEIAADVIERAEEERRTNLLKANGFHLWHSLVVVATVREEFTKARDWLADGGLSLEETNIVPFRPEQVDEYLRRRAELEVASVKAFPKRRQDLSREHEEIQAVLTSLASDPAATNLRSQLELTLKCTNLELERIAARRLGKAEERRLRKDLEEKTFQSWKEAIDGTHGLPALLSNPFLLWLVLPSLTELLFQRDALQAEGFPMLTYTVCERAVERFIRSALVREEPRLFKAAGTTPEARVAAYRLRHQRAAEGMTYAMRLAIWMFVNDKSSALIREYPHVDLNAKEEAKQQDVILFRCLPLRVEAYQNSANFSFRHRMLMEFLVARYFWEDPVKAFAEVHAAGRHPRPTDRVMLDFYGRRLQREATKAKDAYDARVAQLLAVVRDTTRPTAAAMALSLLVAAQVPLVGENLRGVKVPHAVLVHAVLSGSDLTAADFSSVTLCNAVIDYVNLDRANFTHADISEHPPMIYESKVASVLYHPVQVDTYAVAAGNKVFMWRRVPGGQDVPLYSFEALERGAGKVTAIAFSPTGDRLATGDSQLTVRVWNLLQASALPILKVDGHRAELQPAVGDKKATEEEEEQKKKLRIVTVSFSADGQKVASCSGHAIRLWTLKGEELKRIDPPPKQTFNFAQQSPSLHADRARLMVSGRSDKVLQLWRDGRPAKSFGSCPGEPKVAAWTADGERILLGCDEGAVLILNLQGHLLHELWQHPETVRSIHFCPGNNMFVTGSEDYTFRTWTANGVLKQTFKPALETIKAVSFNADGSQLLAAAGTYVYLYDAGEFESSDKAQAGPIFGVALSADRRLLATMSDTIHVWSMTGELLTVIEPDETPTCVTFLSGAAVPQKDSPTVHETCLVTGCDDCALRLWSLLGTELQTYEGHDGVVLSVVASQKGGLLASTAQDDPARVWLPDFTSIVISGAEEETYVQCVAFSSDERIVFGGLEEEICLWSTQTGQLLRTWGKHENPVTSLRFADGDLLASCDKSEVRVWSASGQLLDKLPFSHKGYNSDSDSEEEDEEDEEEEEEEKAWSDLLLERPTIALCDAAAVVVALPDKGLVALYRGGKESPSKKKPKVVGRPNPSPALDVTMSVAVRADGVAADPAGPALTVVAVTLDGSIVAFRVQPHGPWLPLRFFPCPDYFSYRKVRNLPALIADDDFRGVLEETERRADPNAPKNSSSDSDEEDGDGPDDANAGAGAGKDDLKVEDVADEEADDDEGEVEAEAAGEGGDDEGDGEDEEEEDEEEEEEDD